MSIDNTHTKYLKGKDKKAWEGYKDAKKSEQKLQNWLSGFNIPDLKEGEEYEIPLNNKKRKKS